MDAKELRQGNWFIWMPEGKPIQFNLNKIDTRFELHEPIPLTPEILEKCGFEKYSFYVNDDRTYRKGDYVITKTWFHKITGEHQMNLLNDNVKYLHQLQNIWYWLCNEELDINLELPKYPKGGLVTKATTTLI